MDRFKEIRIDYDDHTLFLGFVSRLPTGKLEFKSFHVITHMGGLDYDVTKALNEETISHFRQYFELEVFNKWMDKLHDVSDAIINDFDSGPEVAS